MQTKIKLFNFLITTAVFLAAVFGFSNSAKAQIIFEDDFSNDVGWVASNTQSSNVESASASGCYGNQGCVAPPSKWSAYSVGAASQDLRILAGAGRNGKAGLRYGWGMGAAQRLALRLNKHLTGNQNTGYDELYIRYEVKFDDGWSAGNGTNIGYWKWFRLWQFRPPTGINQHGENAAPYDAHFIIGNLSVLPPSWSLAIADNPNYAHGGVDNPYWHLMFDGTSTCSTCGHFESINNWDFNNSTGAFLNDPQTWHFVEWHIKLSTGTGNCDGTENGIYELWLDGVRQTAPLRISEHYGIQAGCNDVFPQTKYQGGINYFIMFDNMDDWASTWTTDKYLYMNNVVVSTAPIGTSYVPGGGTSDTTYPSAPQGLTIQ